MSLKSIDVTRWKNYNQSEKHKINIFEDDSIEDGINKIAVSINGKSRFYVWNSKFPNLLYSIEDIKWKGFNNNPLKSEDRTNDIIKQPIIYKFNYGLCYFNNINIIFEDDFKDLKNNRYYFTEKKFKTLDEIKKRESKLIDLLNKETKVTESRVNVHRYELSSKLTKYQSLADVYDKLNTTDFIQYIQWVNDNFTLVHKLHIYHTLSSNNLKNWTNIDKITETRCINCYCPLPSTSNSYAKITIYNDMKVTINFILDLRKNLTLDSIEKIIFLTSENKKTERKTIQEYLETSLLEKLNFTPVSIKVYNYVSISDVSFDKLAKNISSYQDIFKSISKKKSINLIYKRSSNFTTDFFDYNIYVRNRLILGVDRNEIIEELVTFNFTTDEANKMIDQELDFLYEMEQQKIKADIIEQKVHTIVIIKQSKSGFDIIIHNIPNKNELRYLTLWLEKIISSSQEKLTAKEMKKKNVIIKPKRPSPPSTPSLSDDELDLGKISYSSSRSSGGAMNKDKENQRYKITLLQNTDKELFGENYSRNKCQKKNQPLVITKEKRDQLIKDGKYYVDNELYYGSKKDKMNYYICPRLWCKVSKVPAHPETGECPIPDEDKIESFFDKPNEIGVKRYVQLVKPNKNDICAPCCFKKPSKPQELSKCKNYETYDPKNALIANIDEKDDTYLITTSAPIDNKRYGAVPRQLQEILTVPGANINENDSDNDNDNNDEDNDNDNNNKTKTKKGKKKETKTKKGKKKTENKLNGIIVRRGIIHKATTKEKNIHTDSLMFALVYLLGNDNFDDEKTYNKKLALMRDIENKLDLITYLSLENGNVCKAFMDKLPIIPSENIKLISELKSYLAKFPQIDKLYNLDFSNDYKLSRFLAIFKSYKKFLNYLSSNDYSMSKSAYFMYAMISIIYNKLLVIFEKNNDNIEVLCPYYTSFDDLIAIMEINPEVIVLLKEGKYYEPIELRYKNKETNKHFKLNDYPKLKSLISSCSTDNKTYELNYKIYRDIYGLNNWIKTKVVFNNYSKFVFETILINNDLTIEHFLTKEGILITIDKIGISFLPRIIKDLDIKKIAFYDDYVNNSYEINITLKDLETFKNKLESLNIKYDIGIIDSDKPQNEGTNKINQIYRILTIYPKELGNTDIIHSRIEDDLYLYDKSNHMENKKWFQLQMMVFKTLLKYLDNNDYKLKELLDLPRIDYINKMMELFKNNPDKNKIRIIIEEIPIYSINHIKNYLNKMILYYKYNFLDPNIQTDEKHNQFLFSQVAIKNGTIPPEIMNYHKSAPNVNFNKVNYNEKIFNLTKDVSEEIIEVPTLMKGNFRPLNSKWVMHKKSAWYQMQYLKTIDYKLDYFSEFFEWYSELINIKTPYETLLDISIQKLKDFKNNEVIMKTLFKDKSIFNQFVKYSKLKTYNVNSYWEKYYSKISNAERLEIIEMFNKKGFYVNDLILLTITQILNISILIIHRAIYGSVNIEDVRGDLRDLVLSSTFMKAPNNYTNRPFLIFYKNTDDLTKYYLVLNKNILPISTKSLYLKLDEIPQEFKELVDEHIKLNEMENDK